MSRRARPGQRRDVGTVIALQRVVRCWMMTGRLWTFVLLLAAASSPASAQAPDQDQAAVPVRAALLDGEREKKATETTPPQRGTIERALSVYDRGGGG